MTTIYIQSFTGAENTQANKLKALYNYSDKSKFKLIDNPEGAQIILVTDVEFDNYGEEFWKNNLIKKYLSKCFILSNLDRPIPLFRGLLTSGETKFNWGRIRSCSYNSHSDGFKNPFISQYESNSAATTQKKFLFSFIGRNCNAIRDQILQLKFSRSDVFVEDSTDSFNLYENSVSLIERQKMYLDTLIKSKFSLCPLGWGANSFRLFESMKVGVAPVIISDNWVRPVGPNWNEFSIFIKEKDIKQIEQKLLEIEDQYILMGTKAKEAYENFFGDSVFFDFVINNCIAIKQQQIISERIYYYFLTPSYSAWLKFKKGKLKSIQNGLNLIVNNPATIFSAEFTRKIRRFISS